MNRVTHFEIPSGDAKKSMEFYKTVFGWSFTQFAGAEYWMADTGDSSRPGINGAIMTRKDVNQPVVNSIQVADIRATISQIEKSGGTIVVPLMPIPGMGWLCYFKDLDGNIFGVMQPDQEAG